MKNQLHIALESTRNCEVASGLFAVNRGVPSDAFLLKGGDYTEDIGGTTLLNCIPIPSELILTTLPLVRMG